MDQGHKEKPGARIEALVEKGLRAQLKVANLLTGQRIVDLNMCPEAASAKARCVDGYCVIPSIPPKIEELATSLTRFVDKLQRLPIDEIGRDLQTVVAETKTLLTSRELTLSMQRISAALKEIHALSRTLNTEIGPGLTQSLDKLQGALDSVSQVLSDDSGLMSEVQRAMLEFSDAVRAVKRLADYLERHPESLIRGKGK